MPFRQQSYSLPIRPTTIWPSRTLKEASGVSDIFALPISHVSVIGTPTPDGQIFHFTLAFVAGNEMGIKKPSIRLDMSPSYTDMSCPMRGIVQVMYEKGGSPVATSPGPSAFDVSLRSGITAGTLCDFLLDDCNMDRYIFNNDGNGCRHWCATALDKLAEDGYIDQSVTEAFIKYEDECAAAYGDRIPMPRIRGTFY